MNGVQLQMRKVTITGTGIGVDVAPYKEVTAEQCEISEQQTSAISFRSGSTGVVRGCILRDNGGVAIDAPKTVDSVTVESCTFANNKGGNFNNEAAAKVKKKDNKE